VPKSQVLDLLREIKSSTFRNAAPLPLKQDNQEQWQGLGFQIGGVRLVSTLGEVTEIFQPPRVSLLPGVKNWVMGVANLRGRLVTIIDVHKYFGMSSTLPSSEWRVLVVEDEDLIVGLLVEQSLGMQHFAKTSFEQSAPVGLESLQEYLQGAYRHGGRIFYQIDLLAIVRDKKFFEVVDK